VRFVGELRSAIVPVVQAVDFGARHDASGTAGDTACASAASCLTEEHGVSLQKL